MINTKYVAEQSFASLHQQSRLQTVITLIEEAVSLNREGEALEKQLHQRGILTQFKNWSNAHQNQLTKSQKASPHKTLMALVNQKDKSRTENEINNILKKINNWGVNGYRVVVQMRRTVTGQELIYHVQTDDHSLSYTLNEQQFLDLLSSNTAGLNYASWEKVEKQGAPQLSLFKLNVGASKTKMKKMFNHAPTINLKRDALYQYLVNTKAISQKNKWDTENHSEYAYHARIAELHSQLLASYTWILNNNGGVAFPRKNGPKDKSGYFITEERKRLVDLFIKQYKKEGLHADKDAFYETGDATLNEAILIENKVGNAVVSISTIKNAIESIASLRGASKEQMRARFIEMFTKHNSGRLTKKIQEGAYKTAVESINTLFKS